MELVVPVLNSAEKGVIKLSSELEVDSLDILLPQFRLLHSIELLAANLPKL